MTFSPQDRRRAARLPALLDGRIYRHSGQASLDCRIRDISDEGACLRADSVHDAPDLFRLEIPARNALVEARVRWRRSGHIGVAFEPLDYARIAPAPSAARVAALEEENRRLRQILAQLTGEPHSHGKP